MQHFLSWLEHWMWFWVCGFLIHFFTFLSTNLLVFISIIVRGTVQADRLAASPKETTAGQKRSNPARVDASKETRKKPCFCKQPSCWVS